VETLARNGEGSLRGSTDDGLRFRALVFNNKILSAGVANDAEDF
jgi:hypothetical protein